MVQGTSSSTLLKLVEQALEDARRPDFPVSELVQQAIRVASRKSDYENLAWLEQETLDFNDREGRGRSLAKAEAHLSPLDFLLLKERIIEAYGQERRAEYQALLTEQTDLIRVESVAEM